MTSEPAGVLRSLPFWIFFETEVAARMPMRETTMRMVFQHLDTLTHPLLIVETGCARDPGNWDGDGQSTVLFDRYIAARDDGSVCHSVDNNIGAVEACRAMVGPRTTMHADDSVAFLHRFCSSLPQGKHIDLLYLDSFDLDPVYWFPSAAHHLKELIAAARGISPQTLVVVDDAPQAANLFRAEGRPLTFVNAPTVGGKGRLVAEYASTIGAREVFAVYQAAWTGF